MTATMDVSNAELARVYVAAYQGRKARLCLAANPGTLTKNSTTAQWDAAEITGQAADGYARVEWTIAAGGYSSTLGMYQGAVQLCTFQALSTGLGLTFNAAYLVTGPAGGAWDTHVAMTWAFSPSKAIAAGLPFSVEVPLFVDDITAVG